MFFVLFWDLNAPKINQIRFLCIFLGCNFFAYNWKLPAYSGAFYLQLTLLAFLLTTGAFFHSQFEIFYLELELFCLQWESGRSDSTELSRREHPDPRHRLHYLQSNLQVPLLQL